MSKLCNPLYTNLKPQQRLVGQCVLVLCGLAAHAVQSVGVVGSEGRGSCAVHQQECGCCVLRRKAAVKLCCAPTGGVVRTLQVHFLFDCELVVLTTCSGSFYCCQLLFHFTFSCTTPFGVMTPNLRCVPESDLFCSVIYVHFRGVCVWSGLVWRRCICSNQMWLLSSSFDVLRVASFSVL